MGSSSWYASPASTIKPLTKATRQQKSNILTRIRPNIQRSPISPDITSNQGYFFSGGKKPGYIFINLCGRGGSGGPFQTICSIPAWVILFLHFLSFLIQNKMLQQLSKSSTCTMYMYISETNPKIQFLCNKHQYLNCICIAILQRTMSLSIQVCKSQSIYRDSIAQWLERWHGTPEALGSSSS